MLTISDLIAVLAPCATFVTVQVVLAHIAVQGRMKV